MALTSSWIKIHIRHYILLEMIVGGVGGQLNNLQVRKSLEIRKLG